MRAFLIALVLVLAGCAHSDGPPECSTGRSADGATSVLRLDRAGERISGTYDVTQLGETVALRFRVDGTATDGRLTSDWAVGNEVLHITGTYTDSEIMLDNPDGKFGTTRFVAGC